MSVRSITNKHVVSTVGVKREEQLSTRNVDTNTGNRSKTVRPGRDFTKNYAITLKDVDTSIISHVKDVMRPTIRESNEQIKVPVMYGNEERWHNVRKRGTMRDKNNSLILPLIMLKRISTERSTEMPSYEHDVQRKHVQVVRNSLWSKDNVYDRFSVQNGIKPSYENIVTGIPNFVNITYEFVLWTSYMEQMNILVEDFVEQNYTYWGGSTDNKFLCTIDSMADASEMVESGERFIKTTFSVITKAYLLPEETNSIVTNKLSQIQKYNTPSKVVFGLESNATNEQLGKK